MRDLLLHVVNYNAEELRSILTFAHLGISKVMRWGITFDTSEYTKHSACVRQLPRFRACLFYSFDHGTTDKTTCQISGRIKVKRRKSS
jgi:hypothetical protein